MFFWALASSGRAPARQVTYAAYVQPASRASSTALAVSFGSRLRPPMPYRPELLLDESPGVHGIVCGYGYDNGVIPYCRRYLRFVDALSHRSYSRRAASLACAMPADPSPVREALGRTLCSLTFGPIRWRSRQHLPARFQHDDAPLFALNPSPADRQLDTSLGPSWS
jgi:hypothetical protein